MCVCVCVVLRVHMRACLMADIFLQVGFKCFLGIVPTVTNWNAKGDEFSLVLDQNPLTDFVELPESHPNLLYSNVMCGVIRGAMEMVSVIKGAMEW